MKKRIPAAAVLALMMAGVAGAQESYKVSGTDVAVYNLAGHVSVVRGAGADVVVKIQRGGSDAARLKVETGELRGRSALRVVYPDDEIVYPGMGRRSNTDVRVRDDGTFFGKDRGDRGDRVQIHGSGRGLEAWADLVVEVPPGKDVMVYLAAGNSVAKGVSADLGLDTGSGSVEASDITGALSVDTGSGSVTVTGVRGSLTVDTGSGSVDVRDVSGDAVLIDTGSGQVSGGGVKSRSLSVDTGSGSIDLDEVTAPDVVLDTGSGSVDIVLLTDVSRLDVDTGSGGVTIHAPADLGADVEIETGSGGIDMDFPVQVRSVRRDYVKGTIGDGKGRIHIDTGSGGVRLIKN
jgi:lia operon protein LiaG